MFYVNNWIANPTHRLSIMLVGVGGTGSHIAVELAQLSNALEAMGRKGFKILLIDPDIVEEHNVGRQKFYPCDVGYNKAQVLSSRINRIFNTDTEAEPDYLSKAYLKYSYPNIIISAVDNLKTRKLINNHYKNNVSSNYNNNYMYYWFDAGNSKKSGQIVLGTFDKENKLDTFIDLFPKLKENKNEPSCSMQESLNNQAFMVNKFTAFLLVEMLSSLLMDYCIDYSQCYFNLESMNIKTNKI